MVLGTQHSQVPLKKFLSRCHKLLCNICKTPVLQTRSHFGRLPSSYSKYSPRHRPTKVLQCSNGWQKCFIIGVSGTGKTLLIRALINILTAAGKKDWLHATYKPISHQHLSTGNSLLATCGMSPPTHTSSSWSKITPSITIGSLWRSFNLTTWWMYSGEHRLLSFPWPLCTVHLR